MMLQGYATDSRYYLTENLLNILLSYRNRFAYNKPLILNPLKTLINHDPECSLSPSPAAPYIIN